ncbi:MAG: hypothetical protein U0414_35305 [Polyangiaceae bacterium]
MDSPGDFAKRLDAMLGADTSPRPTSEALRELVLTAFYASLEREEGVELRFALAYVGREKLYTEHGGPDLWAPLELASPVPLTVDAVAKLAQAADPWRSVIAVGGPAGALEILGVIRTGRARTLIWDCLVLRATAPGHLQAFVGDAYAMELAKGSVIAAEPVLVFDGGLVRARLDDMAAEHGLDARLYTRALRRVVRNLTDRGVGGIVVVGADDALDLVRGGYPLARPSPTLRDAVGPPSDAEGPPSAPPRPIEQEALRAVDHRATVFDEVTSFVADLATIDGALVLGSDLSVLAFGARLVAPPITALPVVRARDGDATRSDGSPLAKLGTRHNSAAALCAARAGVVVFVVSEDGPISAMLRSAPPTDDRLVVWRPVTLTYWKPYG